MHAVTSDGPPDIPHRFAPRTGQTVLSPAQPELAPSHQVQTLYRLSDPALSELGLNEFLDELLVRVREALGVDTVAILLYDRETHELVARAAKGIEEEVEAGVRLPLGHGFAGRIAAERVAIFIPDVDHADILNPILREKGIQSLLGVPLIVEGELIGVLHVGSLTPREFGQRDLAVLQVAAARAAPGIERARLFSALEREHRVAMILQRSLLPKRLMNAVGVETAARYLPATDEVGGDWYDVFELPRGRLGVAIGDVVGHGVRAAALMGQLRTALHAYAMQDYGPARTLELVDRYIQAMPDYAMATAAYAVFEPDTGEVQIASAGHLPPIVVSATGGRVVEITPSAPLGAFSYGRVQEQALVLAPGETLVLYTDGLIERPGTPLTESIDALVALVRKPGSVEELVHRAVDQMVPSGKLRDDVAIVAIQNAEIADALRLQLRADPKVLAEIRHLLRRWLRHHGADDSQTLEITLAVSEACTNAIEHAYSPAPAEFSLTATAQDGVLSFVVTDAGRWRAPRGQDRGRGLRIIRAAMDDVEVNSSEGGTQIVMRRRIKR
jgi:anti-sigma regulatory factor (Ser/Thr protein kinase)/putative methionine-R-sulfoxide reductase with GAF domain